MIGRVRAQPEIHIEWERDFDQKLCLRGPPMLIKKHSFTM